jgi:hypothetical protein
MRRGFTGNSGPRVRGWTRKDYVKSLGDEEKALEEDLKAVRQERRELGDQK